MTPTLVAVATFLAVSAAETPGQELHKAAATGDAAAISALLGQGVSPDEYSTENGFTALMMAAFNGHTDCLKMLLEAGADTTAADEGGSTALIWAAGNGHVESTRLLLDAGADMSARDIDGKTALNWARGYRRLEVVLLLVGRALVAILEPYVPLELSVAEALAAEGFTTLEALAELDAAQVREHTGLPLLAAKRISRAAKQALQDATRPAETAVEARVREQVDADLAELLAAHGLLGEAGPLLVEKAGVAKLAELAELTAAELMSVGISQAAAQMLKRGGAEKSEL